MSAENERRLILDMIENGKITAEEGLGLLNALIRFRKSFLQTMRASCWPAEQMKCWQQNQRSSNPAQASACRRAQLIRQAPPLP